ncbi:MAG: hypothetical protein V1799_16830 [bacterium]
MISNCLTSIRLPNSRIIIKRSFHKAFRRNINSRDFLTATPETLHQRTLACIHEGDGYPGFIVGAGVVPFGTLLDNLRAIREAIHTVKG